MNSIVAGAIASSVQSEEVGQLGDRETYEEWSILKSIKTVAVMLTAHLLSSTFTQSTIGEGLLGNG